MDITSCELDLLLYIYRGCNTSQADWEVPDNSFQHRGEMFCGATETGAPESFICRGSYKCV